MGTKKKSPDVLDGMIEHVRYELIQVLNFRTLGNGWCDLLQPDLRTFTRHSILEAGLIHFRCLIEFLGDPPASDQVMARDYLSGWDWSPGGDLVQVRDLHGRIAHLGLVRRSVATEGDFSWQAWLTDQAPSVLHAFREFLQQLRESTPRRYDIFVQPREGLTAIELLPVLDAVLAEPSP